MPPDTFWPIVTGMKQADEPAAPDLAPLKALSETAATPPEVSSEQLKGPEAARCCRRPRGDGTAVTASRRRGGREWERGGPGRRGTECRVSECGAEYWGLVQSITVWCRVSRCGAEYRGLVWSIGVWCGVLGCGVEYRGLVQYRNCLIE